MSGGNYLGGDTERQVRQALRPSGRSTYDTRHNLNVTQPEWPVASPERQAMPWDVVKRTLPFSE
jgi:hypothetical protein